VEEYLRMCDSQVYSTWLALSAQGGWKFSQFQFEQLADCLKTAMVALRFIATLTIIDGLWFDNLFPPILVNQLQEAFGTLSENFPFRLMSHSAGCRSGIGR